eukprot:TRINITY_DN10536_c0_g1_i5.p3 TRINITY_DN10536_c0_g1~~TRINITY_DN10536_c0_g1_i5.p3  ORF type:complete len:104 (-),score=3.47 TRINITY_DN10536_c0_g1_i5:40-306(-)
MENNQRIRFIISVLFNKPDLEVIGLGMYKEKLMKDLQSRKVYDPTWCVNDQDLIEKEKYIEQVWETTTPTNKKIQKMKAKKTQNQRQN